VTRQVQILAFDGMEVLDYAGPYEVFNVAGEQTSPAAFTVQAVGVSARARPAGAGLRSCPSARTPKRRRPASW
jgi:putative intracellular protease/amidase